MEKRRFIVWYQSWTLTLWRGCCLFDAGHPLCAADRISRADWSFSRLKCRGCLVCDDWFCCNRKPINNTRNGIFLLSFNLFCTDANLCLKTYMQMDSVMALLTRPKYFRKAKIPKYATAYCFNDSNHRQKVSHNILLHWGASCSIILAKDYNWLIWIFLYKHILWSHTVTDGPQRAHPNQSTMQNKASRLGTNEHCSNATS